MAPVFPRSTLDAWLDEIRKAAEDLREQAESLRYGMDQFAPGFDKTAWRKAFDAPLPDRLRCDTALAFVIGIGELDTMIQNATEVEQWRRSAVGTCRLVSRRARYRRRMKHG